MKSTSLYALLALTVALCLQIADSYVRPAGVVSSRPKTWTKYIARSVLARRRRQTTVFTAADIKEIVRLHNELRAGECANNMERMVRSI